MASATNRTIIKRGRDFIHQGFLRQRDRTARAAPEYKGIARAVGWNQLQSIP